MAAIPPLLADLGAAAGALAAIIGLCALVVGIVARSWRRAATALHEQMVDTIKAEVPAAVTALPDVTRDVVREEVDRAIEPHAAQLRAEIRQVRAEMKPNGGSSMFDRVSARLDSVEAGQRKIFAHLDTVGSLADNPDPDDG